MNKLYFALILLISLGMSSCETDIDINADYKDITTVYGLINPSESVHYIKINKAFLGTGSALDLAADANNFTYAAGELDITVQAIDENGTVITTYSTGLGTVIRTENDIIKDQGIFDNSVNVLYKFNASINRDYKYKVIIINTETEKELTAETQIVGTTSMVVGSGKIQFWNGLISGGNYLNKTFKATTGKNVSRVGVVLRFNYTEYYTISSGKDSTIHSISMPIGEVQSTSSLGGESLDFVLKGETFFLNIDIAVSDIATIEDFSHRELNNLTLDYSMAETELNTYMQVSSPSTSVNQDKPSYTNIENGLGIFSSREITYWESTNLGSDQINIHNATIRYLVTSSLLYQKGFCSGDVNIGFPEFPCQQL
jgi:hypothetical protein